MVDKPTVYGNSDLTYDTYLNVAELLTLQQCQSQPVHHDEMLFIIIHQAYELWFKMILLELENTMAYMADNQVLRAHHFLKRVVEIQKLLVSQIHILETMTPIEFLAFREHLNPASGFQSLQFRQIEFIAGLKDVKFYEHFTDKAVLSALRARAEGPDLWESFQALLGRRGFDVPAEVVRPDSPEPGGRERLFNALTTIYNEPQANMDLYLLAEALVDFDAQLSLWRFHHVIVVERVIGFKKGTGGSSGASYLRSTIEKKCFPLLWEVRTRLGPNSGPASDTFVTPQEPGPGPTSGGCPFH